MAAAKDIDWNSSSLEDCQDAVLVPLQGSIKILRLASVEDKKENLEGSLELYKQGISGLIDFSKSDACTKNHSLRNAVREKCSDYLTHAEDVKHRLSVLKKKNKRSPGRQEMQTKLSDPYEDLAQLIHNPADWGVSKDDVVGYQEVKDKLTEYITLPMKFPHLFMGATRRIANILLYGPAGVGKTFLIKGFLSELKDVARYYMHVCELFMHDPESCSTNTGGLLRSTGVLLEPTDVPHA